MVAEDRLSLLPDELLHHILSFIPSTKSHAQTSVLSKRWRHLWTHHPNLRFSMPYPESIATASADEIDSISKSYVVSVDRCLRSYASPSLNSLSVDLWLPRCRSEYKANSKIADRWLRFAGLRSVRKLSVSVRTEPRGRYSCIPRSIFCCRSLAELDVFSSAFPDVPCKFQGFRNLTKLIISGSISNEAVAALLDGCPLLEELKLIGPIGLTYVEISVRSCPRLKHLLLLSYYNYDKWMGASIEAPNLRSIQFNGSVSDLDLKGSTALTEVEINTKSEDEFEFESFDDWMKIVLAVSNASVMKVNYWFYQFVIPKNYSIGPLFKNLKELNCDINWITGDVLRSLTYGLGECPLLEKLLINLGREARSAVKDLVHKASSAGPEDTPDGSISPPFQHTNALLRHVEDEHEQDEWNPSEHLGELDYCLRHLKIIRVKEFLGSKNEIRLSEFLLAKATALEKFVVFDLLKREEWELQEVFATVLRASSQVQMRLSLFDNLLEEFFKGIYFQ